MQINSAHFYVTLKDDFHQRCVENDGQSLFDDLDNPYRDAERHLTPGRIYPVMSVGDEGRRITIIDDLGHAWATHTGLFKYADDAETMINI